MTGSEHSSQPAQAASVARQRAQTDDMQELQHEIEQAREQLGQTVEQLAAKTEVKRLARDEAIRLRARLNDGMSHARRQLDRAGPVPVAIAVGGTTIGSLLLWRYGRLRGAARA